MRFHLRLLGAVYKYCIKKTLLYESESWCLQESEMVILLRAEVSMVRAIFGVQLKDRKNLNT